MPPSKSSQGSNIRRCRLFFHGHALQRVGFKNARGDSWFESDISIRSGSQLVCKELSRMPKRRLLDSPCEHSKSFKGRTAMTFKLGFGLLVAMAVTLSSLAAHAATGAVYTLSNASSGNAVLVYSRAANGQLSPAGTFPTG